MIEEESGILSKVYLHVGDFITIYEEDHEESYAFIKGIFKHKGNNGKYYSFIIIDWFGASNVFKFFFDKWTNVLVKIFLPFVIQRRWCQH